MVVSPSHREEPVHDGVCAHNLKPYLWHFTSCLSGLGQEPGGLLSSSVPLGLPWMTTDVVIHDGWYPSGHSGSQHCVRASCAPGSVGSRSSSPQPRGREE